MPPLLAPASSSPARPFVQAPTLAVPTLSMPNEPARTLASDLPAFLAGLPPATASRMRTIAHAWEVGGGQLHAGRRVVRLVGIAMIPAPNGTTPVARPFTAATLHAEPAHIEFSRVVLASHGVSDAAWQAWSDERPELVVHGLDAGARFPTIPLQHLPDAVLVRLAEAVRDLARLANKAE